MNVKRITPVLLVQEIEPIVPFWVDRLGFAKTIEVPEGNKLGFVAFQKGSAEVMYQTYSSVEKDAPPSMSAEARKGPTYLYMEVDDLDAVLAAMHEGRENRHAPPHRLLRHARIQRSGPRRPLHHLRPARRPAALTRDFYRTRLHCRGAVPLRPFTVHCFVPVGNGGGRRSISVGTAIDRAPFFPTARTAKK